jgi:uncharacterized OsmC-like protein
MLRIKRRLTRVALRLIQRTTESYAIAFVKNDHPTVLCGADQGPTPVEHLLPALSSCLIAGIANVAAARGVTLKQVEAIVEGDIDLRGILGLAEDVRNGYQGIRVSFRISGDAPPDKLREIVEQSQARSAVYDVLTKGVPISFAVDAEN